MKKNLFVLIMAVMVITSCQPKTKIVPVDLDAAKTAITGVLEKIYTSMNARDFNQYLSYLTEDVLVCGTDSREFWNKADISQMSAQMMADTTLKLNFKIDKREIRISKDGNSAVVVEQMFTDFISPKIPIRRVYHLVKNNENWQIDFDCTNLVPNNEDLPKINKALE